MNATPSSPRAAGPRPGGGTGIVRGSVVLRGTPPAMQEIANAPCHAGATPLVEETVVADEQGRLANAVVFLREAPAGSGPTPPPAELDQVNCRYVPHVLAIRVGQALRVTTSDPAVHNVHTFSFANPARNFGMLPGASPVDLTFDKPEEFSVKCDIHPWMNARVHVLEHGHFAVTGPDGRFELKDVPEGEYTLVCRHELFGELEQAVTVGPSAPATADLAYEKPE